MAGNDPRPALYRLILFSRFLRDLGVILGSGQVIDLIRATALIEVADKEALKDTCRALLVSRPEQLDLFEAAFELFFASSPLSGPRAEGLVRRLRLSHRVAAAWAEALGLTPSREVEVVKEISKSSGYSAIEILKEKRFEDMTAAELAQARALMLAQPWPILLRRGRRRDRGGGNKVDLRRSLHHALGHGGEILELAKRRPSRQVRKMVMLCDVSGSMEAFNRSLLFFAHALARRSQFECFLFGTRLTRVTKELSDIEPDRAVARTAAVAKHIGGGTRIGDCLDVFNRQWARRTLGHGAVVLIVSDGWDRGDPEGLERATVRLQRSCHSLIWLNPLLGDPGYAPLTRGLRAALPHVDNFLPAHNVNSLEDLAHHLAALDGKPIERGRASSARLVTAHA